MNATPRYEKLGLFYLGRELPIGGEPSNPLPLLYNSKHLTTHGVIIGMTGSGKTGMGINLIEEAIMDDVPAIIIDPKGDMANLMLTFPDLRPADFQPWIDSSEASRKKRSVEQLAEETARTWKNGLSLWGQGKERIRTLVEKADLTVYTPGNYSGVRISIVSRFAAPTDEIVNDPDSLNALVSSTCNSLLSLVNIEGDPLVSREHVLVSSLLLHFWRNKEDLTIESLIGAIVTPPFEKVGVFGLADYFPQSARMKLAMLLNNVVANPSFSAWLEGDPLDIQHILYGEKGTPRTAIFSIAHLSDKERMFFVTLLLNALISWMRRQEGTSSLRALLYMDEIFGYFPPTGNPPSKKPMLLLLKQARAFGVGVVLATQNPVDLDYKGLSNIGTWFVGRLQTPQDQQRVLDGIVGSRDGHLDRTRVRQLLSTMKGRQFLLASAHLEAPLLFETRWAMSYLKGPISVQDISKLMRNRRKEEEKAEPEANVLPARAGDVQHQPPIVHESIVQRYFLPPVYTDEIIFEPWLAASASVRFYNAKRNIDQIKSCKIRCYLDDFYTEPRWSESEAFDIDLDACRDRPPKASLFLSLPSNVSALKSFKRYEKEFSDYLYHSQRLSLLRVPSLRMESKPGEGKDAFMVRVSGRLREEKEAAIEKRLRKFQARRDRIEAKLQRAYAKLEKEKHDVFQKKTDTLVSFGTAILGAVLGRKAVSSTTLSRTAGGIKKAGRISKEKEDVRVAEQTAAQLEQERTALLVEQNDAIEALIDTYDFSKITTESFSIKPRRSDIFDVQVCLLWEMVPPQL